jgi:predicted enzyme related to lactoylglutathione lyase
MGAPHLAANEQDEHRCGREAVGNPDACSDLQERPEIHRSTHPAAASRAEGPLRGRRGLGSGPGRRVRERSDPAAHLVEPERPRDGERVGGIFQSRDGSLGNPSQWVTYFSVDDVDKTAQAGKERGAQVVLRPVDVPDRGRAALLVDPEGAPFGLIRPTGGDPPPREPPVHAWLWVELWCHSPEAAGQFYGGLFDLQPRALEIAGAQYHVLERAEHSYAGLIQLRDDVRPNWLPVVRVAMAEEVAKRAAELGGRVVLPPSEASPTGSAAIVVDPSGAAVGVQVWPVPVPEVRAAQAGEP